MKNHIIISLLFLSVGLSQQEYDIKNIVLQRGLYKKNFSDELVTGNVYLINKVDTVLLGKMTNGMKDGKWIKWFDNGGKKTERNWKDGKLDGPYSRWFEDGEKMEEITYKDGKFDGLINQWWENGQKKLERTYNDGKPDGLHIEWWKNGKKIKHFSYRDGELIKKKCWDLNGIPIVFHVTCTEILVYSNLFFINLEGYQLNRDTLEPESLHKK